MGILPGSSHNSERNIFVGRTRREYYDLRIEITGDTLDLIRRRFRLVTVQSVICVYAGVSRDHIQKVGVEDVELVSLHDLGRWVLRTNRQLQAVFVHAPAYS
jgi:hypothetical protein